MSMTILIDVDDGPGKKKHPFCRGFPWLPADGWSVIIVDCKFWLLSLCPCGRAQSHNPRLQDWHTSCIQLPLASSVVNWPNSEGFSKTVPYWWGFATFHTDGVSPLSSPSQDNGNRVQPEVWGIEIGDSSGDFGELGIWRKGWPVRCTIGSPYFFG